MRKTILSLLAAFCCSAGIMAQTDDNALRINFTGTGNPIENEHLLEGAHITFNSDGEEMNLTVNNATVTYDLDNVSGMTHFRGTPSVALRANEDPDHAGNYYTTFYSSLEAYTLPEGVKAYTAEVDGDVIRMTAIEGNILPQGEAVLLYSDVSGEIEMAVNETGAANIEGNQFDGVDVATAQDAASYYMLSYGQNQLGFYRMNPSTMLAANKAFIVQSSSPAKAFRMVFAEDEANGIERISKDSANSPTGIYSVSGVRLNKFQKGINIVNGKKIVVK